MTRSDMRGVHGAYMRLNQTDLSGADLSGSNLYDASMVKTSLYGTRFRGVKAPILLQRCPGLESADFDDDLATWIEDYVSSSRTDRRGST